MANKNMKNKKGRNASSRLAKNVLACRLGKAQARARFAPLVESLAVNGGTVEITDYGKTAAVMLGYKDYILLSSQARVPLKPKIKLCGSGKVPGDANETLDGVSDLIMDSVNKTWRNHEHQPSSN